MGGYMGYKYFFQLEGGQFSPGTVELMRKGMLCCPTETILWTERGGNFMACAITLTARGG